jgi:hypothetical protein
MLPRSDLQALLDSLAAVAAEPAGGKRRRCAEGAGDEHGCMVSSALCLMGPFEHEELSPVARQRAQAEARAVVRRVDPLIEKTLDVRIITTYRETSAGPVLHNHVNLRVAHEYSSMIHHERGFISGISGNEEVMFCFMASCELEPVVVLVVLDGDCGRLVHLTRAHFNLLETVLQQFRVRFGLKGETYSYTPLQARLGCSWHSRHFHLKIRIPTEMYLRIFPAMQVLGGNHACKRIVLEPFKKMWEPMQYKFQLKAQLPWPGIRAVVLADVQ